MAAARFSGFIGAVATDIPHPWLVETLKGVYFAAGSVPSLLSAVLSANYTLMMWMVATTTFLLIGIVGEVLEKALVVRSPVRVVVAGW
ncbi:hypothetical protein CRG98_026552 [Punica granatum]|uniref:Uncharacterized protein n=1 Tax=Punica granatum TaxID=22663 RepID=A0A2I0J9P0_PUNGR|nr:hypothetical protein CRG98_026552 [Punica granatum]